MTAAAPFPPEQVMVPHRPDPLAVMVRWRRSPKARRINLRLEPREAAIVITLPRRASRAAGLALLHQHAGWAASRLAALPGALPFADGAQIPIGGVPHRVRHMPGARRGVWIEDGEIRVSGDAVFLPRRTAEFLRAEARRRMVTLALAKAEQAGLVAKRITLKDTRTRWGSCTPDGTLMFSWRLLMAPPHVQDYLAAHEVAHLRHLNHGPLFWRLVASLTPHTDTGTDWLRTHGPALLLIG